MAGFPRFRLYAANGSTLIYEFENVLDWDNSPFQDPADFVEHTSLRGQGSIITEGSTAPWDFTLQFYLVESDYESLVALMASVPNTIQFNISYILKIDLTSGGSTKDLKVKRLSSILFPISTSKKVIKSQKGSITFRVDSWG